MIIPFKTKPCPPLTNLDWARFRDKAKKRAGIPVPTRKPK